MIAAAVLGISLLAAPPAGARLRPANHLKAAASSTSVRLTWKDRARGETRYEVRRKGRKVRLRAGRRSWTDRRVAAATTYRYVVRPCRRRHCAKGRSVKVTTPEQSNAPGGALRVRQLCRQPDGRRLLDLPERQPLEHRHIAGARRHVARLRRRARLDDLVAGLRRERRIRDPLDQRAVHAAGRTDLVRRARGVRSGPYPTPLDAPVEGGSDAHVLTLRQGDCKLFELYAASRQGAGWHAYSGAVWDLNSNALRPETWTSADAAGLPIMPGLAKLAEVQSGVIRHALRITVPTTQKAYIHPATHWASSNTNPNQPPMGLRLRLKASYDISGLKGQARRRRAGPQDVRRARRRQRGLTARVRRR